jgi:hypothetical protein
MRGFTRQPKERERADKKPESIDEWIDMWFAALPYHALLVIKENGVVIGTVRKHEVESRGSPDLYLFLKGSAEFGFGNYRIAASYDGAFRGSTSAVRWENPSSGVAGTAVLRRAPS